MNAELNKLFNFARQALGEAVVAAVCREVDQELKDVTIVGRNNRRAQLGLSSKNVTRVMGVARYKKVSTGVGCNNYKVMFPAGFSERLKEKLEDKFSSICTIKRCMLMDDLSL